MTMTKPYSYLAFPIASTVFNVLFAFLVSSNSKKFVAAQLPANAGVAQDIVKTNHNQEYVCSESGLCLDESIHDYLEELTDEQVNLPNEDENEEDPMLEQMPNLDFKAYRRADISSFYQELPGSRTEMKPAFNGQAGKFVNLSPHPMELNWDSGTGPPGSYICKAGAFESCGTATYPGHIFHFVHYRTKEVVCTMHVVTDVSVYYCNPFEPNNLSEPSSGIVKNMDSPLSLDILGEQERKWYDAAIFNREFGEMYKEFTGGSEWLTNYPSEPPRHWIWRADHFGQEHHIETDQTHFVSLPPFDGVHSLSLQDMKNYNSSQPVPFSEYRLPGKMNITIKAVSCAPRIFQIDNFLSEVEVDHLLDLALRKQLHRSTTGSGGGDERTSNVRTSRTTWLARHSSPIMDAILRRAADVLKIDEALLRQRTADEDYPDLPSRAPINEDLQIVHYDKDQQYTAHHDFGFPDKRPNAPTRSINLCMYLNEGMEGGETAFPRWRNAHTDDAIKATPKKGKAMIFYMRNPDGNLDDLSQHAALPVVEGEKWFANLWTWDPFRY